MSTTRIVEAYEALWDINDVVRYLKVSRAWVYQWSASGLLPSLHIGGTLRFNPVEIRTFAMQGRNKK